MKNTFIIIAIIWVGIFVYIFYGQRQDKQVKQAANQPKSFEIQTIQNDQSQEKDYVNSQQNFRTKVPKGFSDAGESTVYSKYFSSTDGSVELGIEISQGEQVSVNDIQEQLKASGIKVSDTRNISVAGVTGTQQLEDYSSQQKGCALVTYFDKNAKFHVISLFSRESCDKVTDLRGDYDTVINNYQE